jgi:hypothetical protein
MRKGTRPQLLISGRCICVPICRIEVTCIPELPDANYEGMPILLKSQPVSLAPQTENEANYMLQEGKGKYLVHIREAQID